MTLGLAAGSSRDSDERALRFDGLQGLRFREFGSLGFRV